MASVTNPTVLVERQGSVLILKLNRPEKLNALNNTLISAISTELKNRELDDAVRCIIITGVGRAFSAGKPESLEFATSVSNTLKARTSRSSSSTYMPVQARVS